MEAKTLLIYTSADGIYTDPKDASTIVREVAAKDGEEMEARIRQLQEYCSGASRAGANGAKAKLEFALKSALQGTTVVIGHARHHLSDLTEGRVPCTRIGLE